MRSIISILLCTASLLAEDGWKWQNPKPQGNSLYDLYIFDQDHAIAVGSFGTVTRTSDGGVNWQTTNNAGGSLQRLNAVFFIDENTGWAVGENGIILSTVDGGLSWSKQNSGIETDLNTVYFINKQTGWCAGRWGKLLKTDNGGKTWKTKISGTLHALEKIEFINENTGLIIGHNGVILKTINGGQSWQYQVIDKSALLRSLNIIDEENIWISGENGLVFYTSDGGKIWQKKEIGTSNDFASVHFFDDSSGVLCGYTTEYSNGIKYNIAGKIMTTDDGGTTWNTVIADTINPLNMMRFSASGYGWAVGNHGTIIKIEQNGSKITLQSRSVNNICYAIDFADNQNGWIVGYQNILHTSDGGDSWEHQSVEGVGELFSYASSLQSFNANTCIAVGGSIISSGNNSDIYSQVIKTEDGGKTWNYIRHISMEYIFDIDFVDDNTGWIVGFPGLIAKTTNGGQEWEVQTPTDNNNYYWAADFIDALTGWAVGTSGRIRKTSDGGTTWETQSSGTSVVLLDVLFLTAQKGWIIGEGGIILRTEDGGENWIRVKSPVATTFNSIFFNDDRHGRIVGNRGVLLRTDDGGETWYDLPTGTDEDLSCVYFTDDQTGWITSYTGSILKTISGGIDAIENRGVDQSGQLESFSLEQNYPNPFNASTTIEYLLPEVGPVTLNIYNLLGQEVARLVDKVQSAGRYRITWHAGEVPSGLYFYRITAGNYVTTKRLVLLK